jgi:hypothetical protein
MRDWSLRSSSTSQAGDPLFLTLAADARLCEPDYVNDHIWELEIGAGEPAALAVRTTYGLRARNMRLFYRFGESGKSVINPAEFHTPPRLRRFYPNFLSFNFAPLGGFEITAEYWVPESHAIAGRLTIANRTAFARKLGFELCGTMTPLDGQPLAHAQQQMVNVLSGQTGGLALLLFMTGGPQPGPGPYPSLALNLDFDPGQVRSVAWSLAAEASTQVSFDLARNMATRSWDAERARLELVNFGDILDIYTGEADWDAALAFSQTAALGLLFPPGQHLPASSFVQSRQPDGGYSHRGDGQDYPPSWGGQSPLEAYYLASLLPVPVAPSITRGLLENFLSVQAEDGSVDGRPGLAGQRAKFLAAPLLATLAWKYYQQSADEAFLAQVFPKLLAFFHRWFAPDHDRDGDGLPAWDHVLQTGFEDHPLFDVWHPWSQGVTPAIIHDPALEAMLYREATSLILMAEKLNRAGELGSLHARAAALRSSLEASWDERAALYTYRDCLTKLSLPGGMIAKRKGSGDLRLRVAFEQPVRLLIEVQSKNPAAKRPVVEINEFANKAKGETEVIVEAQFEWRSGGWVATSRKVYSRIGGISVQGLEEKDRIVIRTVDATVQDITLFTPLWAHIPEEGRTRALLDRSLLDAERFERPFGIPAFGFVPDPQADSVASSVHLPWNHLIGEGLLAYGFRKEAARLTTHLMDAVVQNLKRNRTFYQRYHAQTGNGIGERGALTGLAPVGLFLQVLGVTIISDECVRLEGTNPFPWPVTIQYKALKVLRGLDRTEVIFPNGRSVAVVDPAAVMVSAN